MPEITLSEAAQTLCALLIEYGNQNAGSQVAIIQRVVQSNSPVLAQQVQTAIANAAPDTRRMTDEERRDYRQAVAVLSGVQRGGPGRGQGRKTNEEKGLPLKETEVLSVRVEPDIADWIRESGGNRFHAELLRKAFTEALVS